MWLVLVNQGVVYRIAAYKDGQSLTQPQSSEGESLFNQMPGGQMHINVRQAGLGCCRMYVLNGCKCSSICFMYWCKTFKIVFLYQWKKNKIGVFHICICKDIFRRYSRQVCFPIIF